MSNLLKTKIKPNQHQKKIINDANNKVSQQHRSFATITPSSRQGVAKRLPTRQFTPSTNTQISQEKSIHRPKPSPRQKPQSNPQQQSSNQPPTIHPQPLEPIDSSHQFIQKQLKHQSYLENQMFTSTQLAQLTPKAFVNHTPEDTNKKKRYESGINTLQNLREQFTFDNTDPEWLNRAQIYNDWIRIKLTPIFQQQFHLLLIQNGVIPYPTNASDFRFPENHILTELMKRGIIQHKSTPRPVNSDVFNDQDTTTGLLSIFESLSFWGVIPFDSISKDQNNQVESEYNNSSTSIQDGAIEFQLSEYRPGIYHPKWPFLPCEFDSPLNLLDLTRKHPTKKDIDDRFETYILHQLQDDENFQSQLAQYEIGLKTYQSASPQQQKYHDYLFKFITKRKEELSNHYETIVDIIQRCIILAGGLDFRDYLVDPDNPETHLHFLKNFDNLPPLGDTYNSNYFNNSVIPVHPGSKNEMKKNVDRLFKKLVKIDDMGRFVVILQGFKRNDLLTHWLQQNSGRNLELYRKLLHLYSPKSAQYDFVDESSNEDQDDENEDQDDENDENDSEIDENDSEIDDYSEEYTYGEDEFDEEGNLIPSPRKLKQIQKNNQFTPRERHNICELISTLFFQTALFQHYLFSPFQVNASSLLLNNAITEDVWSTYLSDRTAVIFNQLDQQSNIKHNQLQLFHNYDIPSLQALTHVANNDLYLNGHLLQNKNIMISLPQNLHENDRQLRSLLALLQNGGYEDFSTLLEQQNNIIQQEFTKNETIGSLLHQNNDITDNPTHFYLQQIRRSILNIFEQHNVFKKKALTVQTFHHPVGAKLHPNLIERRQQQQFTLPIHLLKNLSFDGYLYHLPKNVQIDNSLLQTNPTTKQQSIRIPLYETEMVTQLINFKILPDIDYFLQHYEFTTLSPVFKPHNNNTTNLSKEQEQYNEILEHIIGDIVQNSLLPFDKNLYFSQNVQNNQNIQNNQDSNDANEKNQNNYHNEHIIPMDAVFESNHAISPSKKHIDPLKKAQEQIANAMKGLGFSPPPTNEEQNDDNENDNDMSQQDDNRNSSITPLIDQNQRDLIIKKVPYHELNNNIHSFLKLSSILDFTKETNRSKNRIQSNSGDTINTNDVAIDDDNDDVETSVSYPQLLSDKDLVVLFKSDSTQDGVQIICELPYTVTEIGINSKDKTKQNDTKSTTKQLKRRIVFNSPLFYHNKISQQQNNYPNNFPNQDNLAVSPADLIKVNKLLFRTTPFYSDHLLNTIIPAGFIRNPQVDKDVGYNDDDIADMNLFQLRREILSHLHHDILYDFSIDCKSIFIQLMRDVHVVTLPPNEMNQIKYLVSQLRLQSFLNKRLRYDYQLLLDSTINKKDQQEKTESVLYFRHVLFNDPTERNQDKEYFLSKLTNVTE